MAKRSKSHRRRRHTKRRRTMRGGNPANVGSYNLGNRSLQAGEQFALMHQAQHGGAAPLSAMNERFLSGPEATIARTAQIDAQFAQIQGLKDQAGGRRHRRSRGKKSHRRSRKMRGGSYALTPANVDWTEAVKVPQGVNPQFATFQMT
jgi:hypothetical protein